MSFSPRMFMAAVLPLVLLAGPMVLISQAARKPDAPLLSFSNDPLRQVQTFLKLSDSVGHVTDASVQALTNSLPALEAAAGGPAMDQSFTLPEYVLVQDVHDHPEVQEQIASVILHGYSHWGVKKVFMEGAVSSVDLTVFHRLPADTQEELLKRLVRDGDLSGAELAAIRLMEHEWRNPPVSPFQLMGMEDPRLYRLNLAAYLQVQSMRDRAQVALGDIRRLHEGMRLAPEHLLSKQLARTESLVRLRMTPSEYDDFRRQRAAIPRSPILNQVIKAAEQFYRVADLRSRAFLEQARRKLPAGAGPRMLVVGGYHTPAMTAELRRQNRSFVVITPHITTAGYEPIYEQHLMESVSALHLNRPTPGKSFIPPVRTSANTQKRLVK